MTISEAKQAQRAQGKAARRALSPARRAEASARICAQLAALRSFRAAQRILLYAAFGAEVDLAALAEEAARQGKQVAYPVCGEGFRHPHPHFSPGRDLPAGDAGPDPSPLHRL